MMSKSNQILDLYRIWIKILIKEIIQMTIIRWVVYQASTFQNIKGGKDFYNV